MDLPTQQRDHETRLRRLALRRSGGAPVEFPGRFGASLRLSGAGSADRMVIEYVIDPRPASAGGNGEFERTFALSPLGDLSGEFFRLGLHVDYAWPTRCKILVPPATVWDGTQQAVFTPDTDDFHPLDTLGAFLGEVPGDAYSCAFFEDPLLDGFDRYAASGPNPPYGGSSTFPRVGVLSVDGWANAFVGPPPADITFRLITSSGTTMDATWVDDYHTATGQWPPSMTVHVVVRQVGPIEFDGGPAIGFDTVEFADAGFVIERVPIAGLGPIIVNPSGGLFANAIVVPEPGWYRFAGGLTASYVLAADDSNHANDMASPGPVVSVSWPGKTRLRSAQAPGVLEITGVSITHHRSAAQISGLIEIPVADALVQLLTTTATDVDQGGVAADWENDGSASGASALNTSSLLAVESAHLAIWRYYGDG